MGDGVPRSLAKTPLAGVLGLVMCMRMRGCLIFWGRDTAVNVEESGWSGGLVLQDAESVVGMHS